MLPTGRDRSCDGLMLRIDALSVILSAMTGQQVIIPKRFCGPAQSGNGGYASGVLAELISGPCEVTLRAPPPLDRVMRVTRAQDGGLCLHDDERLIAEAALTEVDSAVPDPVSWLEAERASRGFPGFHSHPYPACFVCGTERAAGDGLRIFPGPIAGRNIAAAPWRPSSDLYDARGRLQPRFVWAALDCPSWFGFSSFAESVPPILLGRLASAITRLPERDERCVVVGWHIGSQGRRIACASALYSENGECLAYSRSTWVTLLQGVTA